MIDGIDDRFRALNGNGIKIKAGAVEHIALSDLDIGEIAPHFDRLADLTLNGKGDAGRRFIHFCDGRGGYGAGERDVVGHRVILRAAHLGHVDHSLDLVFVLVKRFQIGVFSIEMHGNKFLIVAGNDKSVIFAQNFCAGKCHGNIADGQINIRIYDSHDVDPQTHSRKDGDDQREEFTFHWNRPSC